MSGFFSPNSYFIVDLNILIQIISLIILIISIGFKFKKNFKIHGTLMGLAIILHLIFFFIVMLPSLSTGFEFFTTSISLLGVQSMWVHAIPGAIAIILGLYIVITCISKIQNISNCFKKKRLMDITFIVWLISIVFGIVTYMDFYL